MDDYSAARERMVKEQVQRRGVCDVRVLQALRMVARHHFVPENEQQFAYEDGPLPIGYEQTISQPYIVGLMSELLALRGDETVLEIGTGSGYQAAVLSRLAAQVHTIEVVPELARRSAALLADLGFDNVCVHCADGSLGWVENAPYQAVMVTAAAPQVPGELFSQLAAGGRLVAPVGGRWTQELKLWVKTADVISEKTIIPVAFVPLRGKYGF